MAEIDDLKIDNILVRATENDKAAWTEIAAKISGGNVSDAIRQCGQTNRGKTRGELSEIILGIKSTRDYLTLDLNDREHTKAVRLSKMVGYNQAIDFVEDIIRQVLRMPQQDVEELLLGRVNREIDARIQCENDDEMADKRAA